MRSLLFCGLVGLVAVLWPSGSSRGGLPSTPDGRARLLSSWSHGRVPAPRAGRGVLPGTRWSPRGRPGPSDEVADALVLVARALRAGLPLTDALHHVQDGATGTVRSELAAVVAALRWGLPAQRAWEYGGPRWRAAATATHLSEQTGAAAAELLEGAAARLREQGERARERAAARAGVLLVLPLGLGFLPAFACTAVVPVVATLASGVLSGQP